MSNAPIDLIIFDFDGVLVDTQQAVNTLEWQYLMREGFNITLEEYTKRFSGKTAATIVEQIKSEDPTFLSKDTQQLAADIDESVFQSLTQDRIEPIKGVKELLSMLKVKKCVASNCGERILLSLLIASGLAPFFGKNVFCADYVERPKPFPDLFLYAARSMGVDAANALVIEDSETGVRAAVAAGIRVFGFLGGRHIDTSAKDRLLNQGAERVFFSMEELADILLFENKSYSK